MWGARAASACSERAEWEKGASRGSEVSEPRERRQSRVSERAEWAKRVRRMSGAREPTPPTPTTPRTPPSQRVGFQCWRRCGAHHVCYPDGPADRGARDLCRSAALPGQFARRPHRAGADCDRPAAGRRPHAGHVPARAHAGLGAMRAGTQRAGGGPSGGLVGGSLGRPVCRADHKSTATHPRRPRSLPALPPRAAPMSASPKVELKCAAVAFDPSTAGATACDRRLLVPVQ